MYLTVMIACIAGTSFFWVKEDNTNTPVYVRGENERSFPLVSYIKANHVN